MKRSLGLVVMLVILGASLAAQGLYFDVGVGLGKASTTINGTDVSSGFSSSVKEMGVGVDLKLGYGPISGMPLYVVGTLGGVGHRFDDNSNYIQFNSYILGGGVIVYPVSMLQIAASGGYSFVKNQSDLPVTFYDSESGFAGEASVALDIGKGTSGCLIGAEYFYAKNTLKTSGAEQETSLIGIFVKYAYRQK